MLRGTHLIDQRPHELQRGRGDPWVDTDDLANAPHRGNEIASPRWGEGKVVLEAGDNVDQREKHCYHTIHDNPRFIGLRWPNEVNSAQNGTFGKIPQVTKRLIY